MWQKKYLLTAFTSLIISGTATADCDKPEPPAIPDGASASTEAMIEGQQAVKQYLSDGDGYLQCLKNQEALAISAAKTIGVAPGSKNAAALEKERMEITQAYNETVDTMHKLGDQFNAEIKKYKSTHP